MPRFASALALIGRVIGDGDEAAGSQLLRIGARGLFLHATARMRHHDRGILAALIEAFGEIDHGRHGDGAVVGVGETDLAHFSLLRLRPGLC